MEWKRLKEERSKSEVILEEFMRLDSIDIQAFGKWNKMNIEFDPGINIVWGPNEAGKSTIQNFIKAMFYAPRSVSTNRSEWQLIKKLIPWQNDFMGGTLNYSLNSGETFRIERDFLKGSVKIFDSNLNDVTGDFESNKEFGPLIAKKHLGLTFSEFENSIFVGQMGIGVGKSARGELFERITNVSETGMINVSLKNAIEALQNALRLNVGTDRTKNRPLDIIDARLSNIQAKFDDLNKKIIQLAEFDVLHKEYLKRKQEIEFYREYLETVSTIIRNRLEIYLEERRRQRLSFLLSAFERILSEKNDIALKLEQINDVSVKVDSVSNESDISVEFYQYQELSKRRVDLEEELSKKNQSLLGIEQELNCLKIFNGIESNKHQEVLACVKGLEEIGNIDQTIEKIGIFRYFKRKTLWAILIVWTFLIPFVWDNGFVGVSIVSGIMSLIMVLMYFVYWKPTQKIKGIESFEEIMKRKNEMIAWVNSLGMSGVTEYLDKLQKYEYLCHSFEKLTQESEIMENDIKLSMVATDKLKLSLIRKLEYAGLWNETTDIMKLDNELIMKYKKWQEKLQEQRKWSEWATARITKIDEEMTGYQIEICDFTGADMFDISSARYELSQTQSRIGKIDEKLEKSFEVWNEKLKSLNKSDDEKEELKAILLDESLKELEKKNNNEMEQRSEEIREIELKIRELEVMKREEQYVRNDFELIEAEISELNKKKKDLMDLKDSINLAIDILAEAGDEIQSNFVPLLNEKMGDFIGRFTGDKYKKLVLDSSLELRTIVQESEKVVSTDLLSGGTIHQVYLAMRMAIAECISQNNEILPMLLDEVFANFDDERTVRAFELFGEIATDMQLILFTCKEREMEISRAVLGDKCTIISI